MPTPIDTFIEGLDEKVKPFAQEICDTIRAAVPESTSEKLSWAMPTFYLHGNLVHFCPATHHMGFYPGSEAVAAFLPRLAGFSCAKGTIQFPYAKPLPKELIGDIVRFCVAQNMAEAKAKADKKK